MKNQRGLTLLELVITLAIIGLIASLAVPLYTDYLIRARRADAYSALLDASAELARYYSEHHSYKNAELSHKESEGGWYRLQLTSTENTYTVAALPQKAQAEKDQECQGFTLTDRGERGITGPGEVPSCWRI